MEQVPQLNCMHQGYTTWRVWSNVFNICESAKIRCNLASPCQKAGLIQLDSQHGGKSFKQAILGLIQSKNINPYKIIKYFE